MKRMKGQTEVTSYGGIILIKLLLILCLIGIVVFMMPVILKAFSKG